MTSCSYQQSGVRRHSSVTGKRTILNRHHIGDIAKATDSRTAAAHHLNVHKTSQQRPVNTNELPQLWQTSDDEKIDNLFSASTCVIEPSLLVKFHGNQLVLQSPRQPFALSLTTAIHQPSHHRSLSHSSTRDAPRGRLTA